MGPLIDPPTSWAPEWLYSDFFLSVIKVLGRGNVCFVGGAVRDSLLGIAVSDIDMATSHTPKVVLQLLGDASIKTIPTGLQHGTITAIGDHQTCEITTLRRDVATDGRHAEVEFTDDWQVDAERRDFTINALYATPGGKIFDPVGGFADLRHRRVKFIGEPEQRIREDALRIIRFYRFSARFAEHIDRAGQAACGKCVDMIDGLSVERIRDELLKILSRAEILPTLELMQQSGVLHQILGDDWQPVTIQNYRASEAQLNAPINSLVRLYQLVGNAQSASETAAKFKLSNKDRQFLINVESAVEQAAVESAADVRKSFYRFGKPATCAAHIILSSGVYSLVEELSEKWAVPEFPLRGRDLIALGAVAGPELGDALARLERCWIDSDFSLTKNQLTTLL